MGVGLAIGTFTFEETTIFVNENSMLRSTGQPFHNALIVAGTNLFYKIQIN